MPGSLFASVSLRIRLLYREGFLGTPRVPVPKRTLCMAAEHIGGTGGYVDIAPEVVQKFGALKRPESAIGTGPFVLER
jgi:hypothetical protein